ncbi:MAG TPA: LacI family DNA-binding transcriptional regulator [Chitinophaga sp.]|uniref:LacI family DNA-binding transcriptional regulator n=1 Tax=Chitinophaga sp. TaxID=1869181 RepID=UPI002DBB3F7F|nr:LacI family DNA-binding transcriptional regulator [Chitinophaga sp.]HEU4553176.1 LacI family DNA-binding transcriptional regulator [Chitinophaga sp.]
MKKTTIHDIARELNITFSTVARALRNNPAISEATRAAVHRTAEKLNYRQNKLASSLRSGNTHVIGVIVPSLHVSFFSSVVHGIEKVMNENGYSILLYQSNEMVQQEIKGIDTFLQSRVDGIISSVTLETTQYAHYEDIKKRNIPLIFFDRTLAALDTPSVTIDDYQGGFMATEHLVQQGYRRIVHITAAQDIPIFKERLRGYKDALHRYQIPVREELILQGQFSIEYGRSCIKQLREQGIAFDAVFALEDYTAMGVIQQLQAYNIKIPREAGVIGFANEAFGALVHPGLSTVDQQTVKMGQEAARLFLKTIQDKQAAGRPAEKIVLKPILIVRESSRRS